MKIVAFANPEPNTGKTTGAIQLAMLMAAGGHRTILVDLTPEHTTVETLLTRRTGATDTGRLLDPDGLPARPTYARSGLALFSGDHSLVDVDSGQADARPLREALVALPEPPEWAVVDCPSSRGRLQALALAAADLVVIPWRATPADERASGESDAGARAGEDPGRSRGVRDVLEGVEALPAAERPAVWALACAVPGPWQDADPAEPDAPGPDRAEPDAPGPGPTGDGAEPPGTAAGDEDGAGRGGNGAAESAPGAPADGNGSLRILPYSVPHDTAFATAARRSGAVLFDSPRTRAMVAWVRLALEVQGHDR